MSHAVNQQAMHSARESAQSTWHPWISGPITFAPSKVVPDGFSAYKKTISGRGREKGRGKWQNYSSQTSGREKEGAAEKGQFTNDNFLWFLSPLLINSKLMQPPLLCTEIGWTSLPGGGGADAFVGSTKTTTSFPTSICHSVSHSLLVAPPSWHFLPQRHFLQQSSSRRALFHIHKGFIIKRKYPTIIGFNICI